MNKSKTFLCKLFKQVCFLCKQVSMEIDLTAAIYVQMDWWKPSAYFWGVVHQLRNWHWDYRKCQQRAFTRWVSHAQCKKQCLWNVILTWGSNFSDWLMQHYFPSHPHAWSDYQVCFVSIVVWGQDKNKEPPVMEGVIMMDHPTSQGGSIINP